MLPDGFPKLFDLFPSPQVSNIRVNYCWLDCYERSARAESVPTYFFVLPSLAGLHISNHTQPQANHFYHVSSLID